MVLHAAGAVYHTSGTLLTLHVKCVKWIVYTVDHAS